MLTVVYACHKRCMWDRNNENSELMKIIDQFHYNFVTKFVKNSLIFDFFVSIVIVRTV
jgi:hypothetical protein